MRNSGENSMFKYRISEREILSHSIPVRGKGRLGSYAQSGISRWLMSVVVSLLFLLAACSSNPTGGNQSTPSATAAPVNGFGVAANHVHSLIALPDHVLVLATHYGIFRSQDDGTTWQVVAAGPGQLMEGLMAYSLGVS